MDKFIVSARKYRPQTFDTVVGQSHITTTLKNAIRHQQLAHAFLFCGPRGVGKTTCARILAKTINCENTTKEGEACNTCASCISFNEGGSMNYFELDGASNNSVDDIRELVNQVRFVPQTGRYKVYVIDEVHMLSSSAFNAFLKTLEEPPPYAIFILATTEKHKILPTILSRCQIFDFKRITINDTVEHLEEICKKEKIKSDKASLQIIAQKSEGCMRDALSILDKIVSFTDGELNYANTLEHLNILDADCYFKFLACMETQDLAGAMLLYDDINRKGFEGDLVVNGFAEFIRNLLVCKDEKAARLLEVVDSFREKYIETAKSASPALLISALNILNDTEINYKAARNKRLHVELALIKLCYLRQALQLSSDSGELSKKKQLEQVRPVPFRNISPLEVKKAGGKPQTARLVIETTPVKKPAEATPKSKQPVATSNPETPVTEPVAGKLTALDKIRKQYKTNGQTGNGSTQQPLRIETLQAAWNEYVSRLKQAKNPAAQPFEMAVLRIRDENSFEAVTANNIEKQFIDQDRNALFSFRW
jgi:DNA polymerase-3 subunit gamma/tau